MSSSDLSKELYRKLFVLAFLIIVLLAVLSVIRDFLITVILAATFCALVFPFQRKLEKVFKGRRALAAVTVLLLSLLVVVIPLLGMLGVAAKEAIQVSEGMIPWFQAQMDKPVDQWLRYFDWLPFADQLEVHQERVMAALAGFLETAGKRLTVIFSAMTFGTVEILFKLFVGFYAAFFFLIDGPRMLTSLREFLPLTNEETQAMTEKGVGIARATIKSLFVIGAIQGLLVGVAFGFLGIGGAVFWGLVVAILSALPGLGPPLVWIPAVIFLIMSERLGAGVALALWGGVVVGLVDNFLRPAIIGQDTKVPEVWILLSILGGLTAFGVSGMIIGPVLVSVLMSALEIYSKVFKRLLCE